MVGGGGVRVRGRKEREREKGIRGVGELEGREVKGGKPRRRRNMDILYSESETIQKLAKEKTKTGC